MQLQFKFERKRVEWKLNYKKFTTGIKFFYLDDIYIYII